MRLTPLRFPPCLSSSLEHLERLLTSSQDNLNQSIGHYKLMLRKIFDTPAGPLQATKNASGGASYTLTSNYLCLQCPALVTEEDRIKHGTKKAHRFCLSSPAPFPFPHEEEYWSAVAY
jgi:ubiquitin carboxyl-terminal hydrolase 22/27/51